MLSTLETRFRSVVPNVTFCSLRHMQEREEMLGVRQDVPQPVWQGEDAGVMITVIHKGGLGYAATGDLSLTGLRRAVAEAVHWAEVSVGRSVTDFDKIPMPHPVGEYVGPEQTPWETVALADKMALLQRECKRLKVGSQIVDWDASLWQRRIETLYLTNHGGRVYQRFSMMLPHLGATANDKAITQSAATWAGAAGAGRAASRCSSRSASTRGPPQVGHEAIQLLTAPNCPTGKMDVVLAPDQMILQIHESIGHPLEIDRILGDERNYAGTSFVTLDMFGKYRYGSDLLNITYDPTRPEQLASYGYDDDGLRARKEFLIEKGILKRGLGGLTSQARSGCPGLANSRASSWNAPADRPHGQPQPRARRQHAGGDDRFSEARDLHADQLLLVDRRLAQ